jgi:hypothetical protein
VDHVQYALPWPTGWRAASRHDKYSANAHPRPGKGTLTDA